MITRLALASTLLLATGNALAIYQCTDENGSTAFQDAPCANAKPAGKQSPRITQSSTLTSLDETLVRSIYKEQTDAMLSGDLKWLCDIMDDKFSGNIKINSAQSAATIAHKGKKQESCRDYRAMFSDFNAHNRKWQYKVDITQITISEDKTKAVVKSNYNFTVNQPGASSKGSSTDSWAVKDGHVYLVEVKGDATAF